MLELPTPTDVASHVFWSACEYTRSILRAKISWWIYHWRNGCVIWSASVAKNNIAWVAHCVSSADARTRYGWLWRSSSICRCATHRCSKRKRWDHWILGVDDNDLARALLVLVVARACYLLLSAANACVSLSWRPIFLPCCSLPWSGSITINLCKLLLLPVFFLVLFVIFQEGMVGLVEGTIAQKATVVHFWYRVQRKDISRFRVECLILRRAQNIKWRVGRYYAGRPLLKCQCSTIVGLSCCCRHHQLRLCWLWYWLLLILFGVSVLVIGGCGMVKRLALCSSWLSQMFEWWWRASNGALRIRRSRTGCFLEWRWVFVRWFGIPLARVVAALVHRFYSRNFILLCFLRPSLRTSLITYCALAALRPKMCCRVLSAWRNRAQATRSASSLCICCLLRNFWISFLDCFPCHLLWWSSRCNSQWSAFDLLRMAGGSDLRQAHKERALSFRTLMHWFVVGFMFERFWPRTVIWIFELMLSVNNTSLILTILLIIWARCKQWSAVSLHRLPSRRCPCQGAIPPVPSAARGKHGRCVHIWPSAPIVGSRRIEHPSPDIIEVLCCGRSDALELTIHEGSMDISLYSISQRLGFGS